MTLKDAAPGELSGRTAGEAAPSGNWPLVLFLTAAATLSYVDRQILALMIGPVKRDLGISDTQVGLLVGLAFALFYSAMILPMGWLADTRNRRAILGAGIFSWSVFTALSGLARNYTQLFLARMGVGVGEATLSPVAYSLLSDTFARERLPLAVGVFATAPFIGIGLANILGGWLVETLERAPPIDLLGLGVVASWQLTFFAVGLPGVLLALGALLFREPPRRGASAHDHDSSWSEVFRLLGRHRSFFALHFSAFVLTALQGWALFGWVVEFLIRKHEMTRSAAGLAYGAIALTAGLLGSITGGRVATTLLERGKADATLRLCLFAALALAPLTVAMGLAPSLPIAVMLLAPVSFFMAWPPGLSIAALQAVTPNRTRGRAIGIFMVIVNFLAFTLGPVLVGFFNDVIFPSKDGIGHTLALLSVIGYPAAALCLWVALPRLRAAVRDAVAET
jgi:MFS family permease